MGRRVAISQSNYLPWKGYFDLIHDADLFIFHDDLQYTKNDWRNRNRIKTNRGLTWLTIPVGTNEHRLINEVALPADPGWRSKHWRLLQENYCHAPHFARYTDFFREVYEQRSWTRLTELNQFLIKTIAWEFLGTTTEFIDSSRFGLTSRKQDRVIDLLKATGATTYISGPAAKAYLDPAHFAAAGIELVWKDYSGYPDYPQPHPPFEHAVAIVDLLFCAGPEAQRYIWGWRTPLPENISKPLGHDE
jgi:hypothetical protein